MSFDEINAFRLRNGLRLIKRGELKCMRCNEKFYSDDTVRVHTCDECRDLSFGGIQECTISLNPRFLNLLQYKDESQFSD